MGFSFFCKFGGFILTIWLKSSIFQFLWRATTLLDLLKPKDLSNFAQKIKNTFKSGRSCWKIEKYLHKTKCLTIFQKSKFQCRRCRLSTLIIFLVNMYEIQKHIGWIGGMVDVKFCFACFGVGSLKLHMVSTFWNVKDSRVHVWGVCDFITFNNVGHQSSNAQHWIHLHLTQFNSISCACIELTWIEWMSCMMFRAHEKVLCAKVCVCVWDFGSNSCWWSSCYTGSWNHRQKNNR
jgi:hypothetical protein